MNMKDLGLVCKKIHPQVINSAAKLLFNTYIYYLLYYLLGNLPKFRLLNHEIYLNFKSTKFNRKRDLGYYYYDDYDYDYDDDDYYYYYYYYY